MTDYDLERVGQLVLVGAVIGGVMTLLSFCYFGYCLFKGKKSRGPASVAHRFAHVMK